MERLLIWLGVLLLVAAVVIPALLRFIRQQRLTVSRREEARAMGIDRPRAQFPMVDRSACIGCGACVQACPEHDVLGVVWGTAEVINGERCVGHGLCEQACPVGALKVGLGDITSRPDIPLLSPSNESSVPGLFIAGELGGLSLIRNAISQGRTVIDEIAARAKLPGKRCQYDVVIVGAGPAGLSAGLNALNHKLNYLLIDEREIGGTILHYPRQKLVMTQPVEIPLYGRLQQTEYTKETLVDLWQSVTDRYNLNVRTGEHVDAVASGSDVFTISTTAGTYTSRFVVLAMGRRGTPRKLDVPGEELPKVIYQLIDAQSYRDKHLLVVGGGDSAVEAAVGLAKQPGNVVTISYRKNGFHRVKKKNETAIDDLVTRKKIVPIFESQVTAICPESVILATSGGPIELPNDYVIVQIGGVPPFEMLRSMGIEFGGHQKPLQTALSATV